MPRIVRVDPATLDHPSSQAALAQACELLRRGGLVAFPSETVYGLGARALDAAAVLRIFSAKGRPLHHPLIAHVADEERARELASEWPERASRLAKAFWPGPLSLVVKRASHVPAVVAGGADSLAVRAPAHPVARALLERFGEPIAAPSANRYQELSPTEASHVVKSLGDAVDLVLDAGPCSEGIESTVVDVRGDPRVLRPGPLGLAELRRVVAELAEPSGEMEAHLPRPSPGMDTRHYAPKARLEEVEGAELAVRARSYRGLRLGALVRGAWELEALVCRMPLDAHGYGQALFASLHALDDAGVEVVLVEAIPAEAAWWAIADRLTRARAG